MTNKLNNKYKSLFYLIRSCHLINIKAKISCVIEFVLYKFIC